MNNQEKCELSEIELKVLKLLSGQFYGFEGEVGFLSFKYISKETGLERDLVRVACRSLADKGLAKYARGLTDEDGVPAGSGYGVTERGYEFIEEMAEKTKEGKDPTEALVEEVAKELDWCGEDCNCDDWKKEIIKEIIKEKLQAQRKRVQEEMIEKIEKLDTEPMEWRRVEGNYYIECGQCKVDAQTLCKCPPTPFYFHRRLMKYLKTLTHQEDE